MTQDTDFWCICILTLTLEIWPWVKVMTHPWVMDNNCVKYYPDPAWAMRSYGPNTDFGYVFTVTLTLENPDMTLGQGHDTPWGHGLCEILSRSDKGVKSYGPDTMWSDRQMDRQIDRSIPIDTPQNFVCRGLIIQVRNIWYSHYYISVWNYSNSSAKRYE